ncbi:unnamed protein product [Caenorhabditis bovis]|uniref:protein-disulfide reductase n=1 Tax=Caenorhabditis bovis TaxID=2654633 RepID=A0A8S1F2K6_9PELO|nr:unnamed protein product [Caenorhabditis bovis]
MITEIAISEDNEVEALLEMIRFDTTQLKLKDGSFVNARDHIRGKIVVLYFSASWCNPCRQFTPLMKQLSEKIAETNQPIEVILVSKDYMRFQMEDYYEKAGFSFAVIPLKDPIIEKLMAAYNVAELPSCRVVDERGYLIDSDARFKVEQYNREKRQITELFDQWRHKQTAMCV